MYFIIYFNLKLSQNTYLLLFASNTGLLLTHRNLPSNTTVFLFPNPAKFVKKQTALSTIIKSTLAMWDIGLDGVCLYFPDKITLSLSLIHI